MDKFAHFIEAQAPLMEAVEAELVAGRKQTHWMWFVFPQLHGLGHSPMARRYAIHSLAEAQDYLEHSVLGPRLRRCTGIVNAIVGRSIYDIFGAPDDLKFRSSMTLFDVAAPRDVFHAALEKYCHGSPDEQTLEMLEDANHAQ